MEPNLKDTVEALGRAFEEFKTANDQQIAQLKSGKSDPLLEVKLQTITTKLDELQAQKDALEAKMSRPAMQSAALTDERKACEAFNVELKAHAASRGVAAPADMSVEAYNEYKSAFVSMLRKGREGGQLSDQERKTLLVGSDSDGGYLVPADMSGRITTRLYESSPIRQLANVQTISSDRLEGIEDLDEAAAGWVGETETRAETNTPRIGKYEIPAMEMYAQPKATQRLLDDAAVDVEAWLTGKVSERLARLEATAFVTGDGTSRPRGFTAYPTAATADATRAWGTMEHINTGVNGAFASSNPADTLHDLVSALKIGYLAGARWVTRRTVIALIRKFKESTTNAYIWQPGLQAGQPAQLLGYPITLAEDMPALATGSLSMGFGDFRSGYQIVDRLGVRVLRDPYTEKPYIKFYTTRRVGGAVVNFEAIKFVRFAA